MRARSTPVGSNSLRGQCEGGISEHALLAGDELALEFDSLLFVGCEGDLVLDGPDCPDRSDVAALGAEEGVEVQTLDVIELQFHGFE